MMVSCPSYLWYETPSWFFEGRVKREHMSRRLPAVLLRFEKPLQLPRLAASPIDRSATSAGSERPVPIFVIAVGLKRVRWSPPVSTSFKLTSWLVLPLPYATTLSPCLRHARTPRRNLRLRWRLPGCSSARRRIQRLAFRHLLTSQRHHRYLHCLSPRSDAGFVEREEAEEDHLVGMRCLRSQIHQQPVADGLACVEWLVATLLPKPSLVAKLVGQIIS